MGFFSFVQEIAMDLGTANTIIISDDKIVVDEPSVVALDRRTDKMIAVGEKAKMMYEKTHDNIKTIRPLRSEEHTSELQSRQYLVCRLLLEKKKQIKTY